METPIGEALQKVNTSHQWSTLRSVVTKLNRCLPSSSQAIDGRGLASFLESIDVEELNAAGIWTHSFGAKYEPLVLTNPAYARARRGLKPADDSGEVIATRRLCRCRKRSAEDEAAESSERYFGSTAYNAGRHSSTQSTHAANCPRWTPPSTGHLHSWRRTFEE